MKVLKIFDLEEHLNSYEHDLINKTLTCGVPNDYYLDKYLINVRVEYDHPKDMFYRALRAVNYSKIDPNEHVVIFPIHDTNVSRFPVADVAINLTEAISFIQMATPPLIKTKHKDLIELYDSVEKIIETLNMFLVEGLDSIDYNMDIFQKCMYMKPFPTAFNYNTQFSDVLEKRMDPKFSPFTIHVQYTPYLSDLVNGRIVVPRPIQLMIRCHTKNELAILASILKLDNYTHTKTSKPFIIISMNCEDDGYYIGCTTESFDPKDYPEIIKIIQHEYKGLV